MTNADQTTEFAKQLFTQAIKDELICRGLSPATVQHFTVDLAREDGKLRLTFPSNFRTLKLNAADERSFKAAFNGWAEDLATTKREGTFTVTAEPAKSIGLRRIECSAFNAFDLIRGVNNTLQTNNQIDATLLGRSK